jgi:hypothetical protein
MDVESEKDKPNSLAKEVERCYQLEFLHPFPYKDCYRLQRLKPDLTSHLIPHLDLFFSFIAGYSSSATRLRNRTQHELRTAIPKLKRSFFDVHPEYKSLAKLITPSDTPALHHELHLADQLRFKLVELMQPLI